jgi:hypothetical protein
MASKKSTHLRVKQVTVKSPNPDPKYNFTGYGITNGSKWFFTAYKSQEQAQTVLDRGAPWDDESIRVNISYPEPGVIKDIDEK